MPAEHAYVPRMTPPASMTADELLHVSIPDKRVEVVKGVLLVRELPGLPHARGTMDFALRLGAHARAAGPRPAYPEAGVQPPSRPEPAPGPDHSFINPRPGPHPQ